jgi:hypothetical protein
MVILMNSHENYFSTKKSSATKNNVRRTFTWDERTQTLLITAQTGAIRVSIGATAGMIAMLCTMSMKTMVTLGGTWPERVSTPHTIAFCGSTLHNCLQKCEIGVKNTPKQAETFGIAITLIANL